MIAALYIDRIKSRHHRYVSRRRWLCIAAVFTMLALVGPRTLDLFHAEWIIRICVAIGSIAFAAYFCVCMIEAMWLSLYARSKRQGKDYWKEFSQQYGIATVPFAHEAAMRIGIPYTTLRTYRELNAGGTTFSEHVATIFSDNQELRTFLEKHAVTKAQWTGVWSWLESLERKNIESVYILDDEHLERMATIGEAFSYGQTILLSKIGKKMIGLPLSVSLEHFYARAFSLLEQTLEKSEGANSIVIAPSIEEGEDYIRAYIPHAPHKKFVELDTESLLAIRDAQTFERMFSKVLEEAAFAGNIVLVIPHISSIIDAAHALGYDAAFALNEYMRSTSVHIILIVTRQDYHATLETNASIVRSADKIELDALAPSILQSVAESEVLKVESRHGVIFSYQGLTELVNAVARYGEDLHDTLRDYLEECALFAKKQAKDILISQERVKAYIAQKTGTLGTFADASALAPTIEVRNVLSQRIKGQDKAIEAVAQALERARAGLGGKERPLGTFLFLGPTGVGKTETAKALSQAYFGTDDKMLRFDMSEFSDTGAVAKLIGSFELGEPGVLASKARDIGHGVMLFDEIEKSHEKVRDLMLQMLDEGYVTDARGNKVNMKNFIMIATSNAGSDEIYRAYSQGKSIEKNALVNSIIERGIFRPEFINRFDDVVIYNPLSDRYMAAIATLKLQQYARELYEQKTIHMNITPGLVEYIMDSIENKAFGGREIRRIIQGSIESLIAKEIIGGRAKPGSTIAFGYNKQEKKLVTMYT